MSESSGVCYSLCRRSEAGLSRPSARLIRVLQRAGWQPLRQSGSHVHMTHPDHPGALVTVAMHARQVPIGKLTAILRSAGLSADDLRELL